MKRIFFPPLLIFLIICSCSESKYPGPLSPQEALDSFRIKEGFKMEIFAAEPHALDPVSMVFDGRGHIYIVEMPDYPYKPEPGEGKGRIRMIEDTDGDGRVDASTIFADSISEATSILPWKDGLLVTAAPNILYLKDTDGDNQADSKEVLFTGFFENNSEAQITNLRYSVDNWIYAANYGQPGNVKFTRKPKAPELSVQGGDFRFRLDEEKMDLATGPTQFGHTINDWGHRFMAQNTIHLRQAVIPRRYLERHDHLPSKHGLVNISDHDPLMYQISAPPYWRVERTKRRNKRYDEQGLDRTEYAEDHFTGASGSTIFLADAFPDEYYGNIFTGDVAGNLVHRDVITLPKDSPVYIASRGEGEQAKEFIATKDPWFRPANFTVGPDGYLYVIDMYRQHIETPLSIPEDLKKDMDFYNGIKKGRIYRVLPQNREKEGVNPPDLTERTSVELVDLLSNPNHWWRINAQRILIERQNQSVVPQLKKMFLEHEDPRARLHALFSLEGLGALDQRLVENALEDSHPGIRENAMVLSEQFKACLPHIVEGLEDPSARVALQACLSLGEFSGPEVKKGLANCLQNHGKNPWFRKAVLSSNEGASMGLFEMLSNDLSFFGNIQNWKSAFLEDFAYVTGSRNQQTQIYTLLNHIEKPSMQKSPWQKAALSGLCDGLKKHQDDNPGLKNVLENIKTGSPEQVQKGLQDLKSHYSASANN